MENEIQKRIFEIAVEFKKVCEANNLKYFLDSGTLLGAVRHKGFIPWDDDIDFAMPRSDYNKLLSLWKNGKYALRTIEEDNYVYSFAKIDDTTTTLVETYNKKSGYKGGVYIDIFPLDGVPTNRIKQKIFLSWCKFIQTLAGLALLDFSNVAQPLHKKILIKLAQIYDGKKMLRYFNKLIQKYDFENSEFISSVTQEKIVYNKKIYESTDKYIFENEIFCSVKDADTLLRKMYGDYMQLPPLEKRVSNHYIDYLNWEKPY